MSDVTSPIANLAPLDQAREQKAWYWYDWANSAYTTTIGTVFFGPYFISLAENAVGGEDGTFRFAGLDLPPDSLFFWLITVSTILSALVLPPLGAYADRVANKKGLLAALAWTGAFFAALIFFATGDNWQLAALGIVLGNLFFGAAGVVNDSILPLISDEENRDRVSSRGWAWGYLGGGLLLVINLAVYLGHDSLGLGEALAARLCMLSAAVWWAGFTLIPFLRLRNHPPVDVEQVSGNAVARSFGQLAATLRDMRNYPMALTFLVAYLFFNDGIQTVIASASVYGSEELGHSQTILIATILMVQFVAFGGALLFGRLAARLGAKRTILGGLAIWCVIVTVALFLPAGNVPFFLVLGAAIGIVLGGTQALARSYFSLLIPRGKEAEYFSFYHAMDRGTSWFGTATFGIVLALTDSYRPAIFALIAFFVIGGLLLTRVDTERGIREAGNDLPSVI
ncbi:UMF1 family MFS transporter [Nocardioides cavernae]|uniref:UMF1 family MFS transporter n=1 Tax=Nocardioides cavernae TaxID=1921566 RepID=A0A7Y9KSZ2_9ACTN|nr:MFS transporter [Nocardioides cavernae]NYE38069.1 UMF1 family MFS transporter [Nocardioides cavernae]